MLTLQDFYIMATGRSGFARNLFKESKILTKHEVNVIIYVLFLITGKAGTRILDSGYNK